MSTPAIIATPLADLAAADDAAMSARAILYGALIAETGISREMFDRLGVVL